MGQKRQITRPELVGKPFRLIIDFSSYEDANCARELLEPLALGPITIRAKEDYFRPTMSQSPRMRAMRRELAGKKSFDCEMIGAALDNCGYSATKNTIGNFVDLATKHGVIERLEKGLYQFLPLHDHQLLSAQEQELLQLEALMCKGCQPEPLQCQPL